MAHDATHRAGLGRVDAAQEGAVVEVGVEERATDNTTDGCVGLTCDLTVEDVDVGDVVLRALTSQDADKLVVVRHLDRGASEDQVLHLHILAEHAEEACVGVVGGDGEVDDGMVCAVEEAVECRLPTIFSCAQKAASLQV